MSNQVQIRRGTSAQVTAITPASSEVVHNTTDKRLHVGDGTTAGGIILPKAGDLQTNAFTYAVAGGTADALTATFTPSPGSYSAGQIFRIKAAANNTGNATINVNALGAKNILKMSGGSLVGLAADDLVNGGIYEIAYDGTQFQLLGTVGGASTDNGSVLLSVQSAASSTQLDFTGLDGSYDNYKLVLSGLVMSSSSADLRMRLGFAGSIVSGASDYDSVDGYLSGAGAWTDGSQRSTSYFPIAYATTLATQVLGGQIDLFAIPGLYVRHKSDTFWTSGSPPTAGRRDFTNGGMRTGVTALTDIRLYPSAGTISSGSAYLFGLKSSI
jgi:hypothetical protein